MDSLTANKALYKYYIEEVFNKGNVALLDELLSDDYVYHEAPPGTPPGRDGIKAVVEMFRAAFPDLNIVFEDQIAEGDKVASRTVMYGTHSGAPIFGIQPSGNKVAMPGMTMVTVKDGRITESWVRNDVGTLMKQLGAK